VFELGEALFDGIDIRAIGRQEGCCFASSSEVEWRSLAAGMLREAAALTTQITGEVIPAEKPGILLLEHEPECGADQPGDDPYKQGKQRKGQHATSTRLLRACYGQARIYTETPTIWASVWRR
jgi:hypothetical protein